MSNKLDKYGQWCHYCHRGLHLKNFTLDHFIPRSKGGANADANLVACCKRCNILKSDFSLEVFRQIFILEYTKSNNAYALSGRFAFEASPLITRKVAGAYSKNFKLAVIDCVPPKNRADWTY